MHMTPQESCSDMSVRETASNFVTRIPRSRLGSVWQRLRNDCEGTRRGLYLRMNLIGVTIATDEVGLPPLFFLSGYFLNQNLKVQL
jgi:hypothetical protein